MGGKILSPHRHRGKFQHGPAQSVDQLRAILQKNRDGRIAHIHGADAAVGVVLLGEKRHLARRRGNQLVGGKGVAPRGVDEPLVVLARRVAGILRQPRVQPGAVVQDRVKMFLHTTDRIGDLPAVPAVPGLAQIAEIVDRGDVIVGDDELRGRTAR